MMHAIADENLEAPVIQHDRNVNGDLLIGIAHEAVDALFQAQLPGGDFEARFRRSVHIHFVVRRQSRRGHNASQPDPWVTLAPEEIKRFGAGARGNRSIRTAARRRKMIGAAFPIRHYFFTNFSIKSEASRVGLWRTTP